MLYGSGVGVCKDPCLQSDTHDLFTLISRKPGLRKCFQDTRRFVPYLPH